MSRLISVICSNCVVAAMLLMFCQRADAKDTEIPPVISSGLNAYQTDGPEAAFKVWLAGSPLEGDKAALSQANVFRQVESLYGTYQGFDLIKVITLTPRTKFVYLQINLQKGPLFAHFTCYKEQSGWIITMLNFNTEAEKVIPWKILDLKK